MMIANWMHDSVSSQVVSSRLFPTLHGLQVSRSNPASYAQKRDREVPYGMKGGEH